MRYGVVNRASCQSNSRFERSRITSSVSKVPSFHASEPPRLSTSSLAAMRIATLTLFASLSLASSFAYGCKSPLLPDHLSNPWHHRTGFSEADSRDLR
jgi:hypothetical protein